VRQPVANGRLHRQRENNDMENKQEVRGRFKYEQDSKRFHRFQIETEEGVVGTVYVPKDLKPMPKTLVLEYAGRASGQ